MGVRPRGRSPGDHRGAARAAADRRGGLGEHRGDPGVPRRTGSRALRVHGGGRGAGPAPGGRAGAVPPHPVPPDRPSPGPPLAGAAARRPGRPRGPPPRGHRPAGRPARPEAHVGARLLGPRGAAGGDHPAAQRARHVPHGPVPAVPRDGAALAAGRARRTPRRLPGAGGGVPDVRGARDRPGGVAARARRLRHPEPRRRPRHGPVVRGVRGGGVLVPANPALLPQYATALAARGHATPWPPARTSACWCGSGREYADCHGTQARPWT